MMGTAHQQASAKLITDFNEERVQCNNIIRPKEIINEYQMEFETHITYWKAHRARELALLPLYFIELQRTSPDIATKKDITSDDQFKCLFWAFSPCLRSFQTSLRPLMASDDSHFHGKYPKVILVVVIHDANHRLFLITFVFVEVKRHDSWEWFLANLSMALSEPKNLTIVSDYQKGLTPVVQSIFLSARHYFCFHHIA